MLRIEQSVMAHLDVVADTARDGALEVVADQMSVETRRGKP